MSGLYLMGAAITEGPRRELEWRLKASRVVGSVAGSIATMLPEEG